MSSLPLRLCLVVHPCTLAWRQEEIRKKTGYIVERAEGVFDVDANTTIEDVAEVFQVEIPPVSE